MRIRKGNVTAFESNAATTDEAVEQEDKIDLKGDILETEDGKTTAEFDKAVAALPESIRQAITDGHVIADVGLVKRKDAGMQYVRLQAKTADGCALISGGNLEPKWVKKDDVDVDETNGDNVVNHYNYGKDLKVRNLLTQRLAALVEGPDKALEAAARNIAKAKNISIEAARDLVKTLMG